MFLAAEGAESAEKKQEGRSFGVGSEKLRLRKTCSQRTFFLSTLCVLGDEKS